MGNNSPYRKKLQQLKGKKVTIHRKEGKDVVGIVQKIEFDGFYLGRIVKETAIYIAYEDVCGIEMAV